MSYYPLGLRAKYSPKTKRQAKNRISQKRRQLCQEGLKKAKQIYNQTKNLKEIDKIDYYTDQSFIKKKARKSIADYIEQRCSGSRVIIGYFW